MARGKNGQRNYKPGDPIHIVVTQEFADDANRFFSYCRDRGYNPSQVIRQAMMDWLDKEENTGMQPSETIYPNSEFDEKIIELLRERKKVKNRMNLRSVKEILEEGSLA